MNYRLAAYVLEDKVKGNQTLGTGQVQKDYTHRHVVRQMLSSTVYGDGLGEVRKGAEVTRTFTFKADEAWNVANLSVAVLAIDPDGHVNNMAQCAADGGKMDYEYINR
jgi:predicted Zn-dependent protease